MRANPSSGTWTSAAVGKIKLRARWRPHHDGMSAELHWCGNIERVRHAVAAGCGCVGRRHGDRALGVRNGVENGRVSACVPTDNMPERKRAIGRDRSHGAQKIFYSISRPSMPCGLGNPPGHARACRPPTTPKRCAYQHGGSAHSRGGNTDSTSSMVVSPAATFSRPVRRSVRRPSPRAAWLKLASSVSGRIRARRRGVTGSSSYRPTGPGNRCGGIPGNRPGRAR